ncbi:hypothetical protein K8I28_08505 [bacterium]|nr:hypothetical protein [bacterium]
MNRNLFVLLAILMMAFSVSAELVFLEPTHNRPARGPVIGNDLDEYNDNFLLTRVTGEADYYLSSGAEGDTMCVVFNPVTECSLYAAEMQFFAGGNLEVFVWEYNIEAGEFGQAPPRGQSPESPLGDIIFGPFETQVTGSMDWEPLFTPNDIPDEEGFDIGDAMFVVGFVKTQDDGFPQPLADDVSQRGFCFTWFGGPWTEGYDNVWGSYSSDFNGTIIEIMMRTWVGYYGQIPPFISNMTALSNTVSLDKTCEITVDIVDDNGWDGEDEATLYVRNNFEEAVAYPLVPTGEANEFIGTFDLSDFNLEERDEFPTGWLLLMMRGTKTRI